MEKSQNIAATVRKHHEWILKLGVSAFNGQSTERSKAILTKCAPVECRKKYPPHGLSRATTQSTASCGGFLGKTWVDFEARSFNSTGQAVKKGKAIFRK
jgi:hypothetical protein